MDRRQDRPAGVVAERTTSPLPEKDASISTPTSRLICPSEIEGQIAADHP